MKQLIVLLSTIVLGIVIYQLIMGTQESSIVNVMGAMWRETLGMRVYAP